MNIGNYEPRLKVLCSGENEYMIARMEKNGKVGMYYNPDSCSVDNQELILTVYPETLEYDAYISAVEVACKIWPNKGIAAIVCDNG